MYLDFLGGKWIHSKWRDYLKLSAWNRKENEKIKYIVLEIVMSKIANALQFILLAIVTLNK